MSNNKITHAGERRIKAARCSDGTKSQYLKVFRKFADWATKEEGTSRIDRNKYHDLIERYLSQFENPTTHHTYLSALCCACNLKMNKFENRKKRGVATKGRDVEGVRNAQNARICRFAELTGIRHSEVAKIRQNDLIERDGFLYVVVRKGKGGKYQEQLILPEYTEEIKGFFEAPYGENGYLFEKDEVKAFSRANPHRLRRLNAWKAYEYFLENKATWRERLKEVFLRNPLKQKAWEKYVKRCHTSPIYELRGERRAMCEKLGVAYRLDREAVMMASVFMLAHYREQVTVDNYLLDGMLGR